MIAVDQYQAATEQLAGETERAALLLYGQYRAGQYNQTDTALLLAALINRANATATALADVWVAIQIEQLTGEPIPTVGVLPVDGSERLVKAANTILGGQIAGQTAAGDKPAATQHLSDNDTKVSEPETNVRPVKPVEAAPDTGPTQPDNPAPDPQEMQVARLARCEPLEAAQQASHDAMQQQPLVEGWVRHMDANPCQLCVWWRREGRVWPKAHPMPRHKGCNCQPEVVLRQSIKSTQFTRRLERNT